MSADRVRCPSCGGRGSHHCECWPGDCICGFDDEPCEECEGGGWIESCDDDFDIEDLKGETA